MNTKSQKKNVGGIIQVFIVVFGLVFAPEPLFGQLIPKEINTQIKKALPQRHYIRSHNFDVKHISLDLSFDWEKEQAFGVEEFTFSPLEEEFKELVLDAGYMIFEYIKIKGGANLDFKYEEDRARLTIKFEKALDVAEIVTLVIKYQTKGIMAPSNFFDNAGLKFVKPVENAPNNPWQIRSLGFTEYNKYWFPSYDYPNDFRTTELSATVKNPLMVISNGKLVETRVNSNNTRTFHWKMDAPHANYQTSIVVGEYIEIREDYEGIPITTYTYKNWKDETEVTVKRLPDMMKYFSEKLDLKYPYIKYSQTIVYESTGGMANISATTITENMIHDARTSLDGNWDKLQAHELAHQWFGDYITYRDWSESWLHEGFVTYLAMLWDREYKGKEFFLFDVNKIQNNYLEAWERGERRPIVTKYFNNPQSLFDVYAYSRGAAVLHMLRKQLGDEKFWRALSHYLKSNAHQSVSTENLRVAIEESTGHSMDMFFDQWIYKMGHPVFEVSKSYDRTKEELVLNVKQVQKADMSSAYPQVKYFQTPVEIEIVTAGGSQIETVLIEAKEENVFKFSGINSEPLIVDFDNEGTLIKELKFDKSTNELIFQLNNDWDVLGRKAALGALVLKAKAKDTSDAELSTILSNLIKASTKDKYSLIRSEAISEIMSILILQQQESEETEVPIKLDQAIVDNLQEAAFDPESVVRVAAIRLLGASWDNNYADLFHQIILSDSSYDVIDITAIALAKTKSKNAYMVLNKLAQTASWKNRLEMAGINGLTILGDKRALDLGLKLGQDKTRHLNIRTSAVSLASSVGADDPRTFPLVFSTFNENINRNRFGGIESGLLSFIKLADPRGQKGFDIANKWWSNYYYFEQLESQFKAAIIKD